MKDPLLSLPLTLLIWATTLHNCSIPPPSASQGFDRLICLELCNVTISFELLESLISHCPLLEQLVLKISEILNVFKINAPMLRSFDFTGDISSVFLENAPLLAKVSLISDGSSTEAKNFDVAKFFESCSALEHLLLQFCYYEFFAREADAAPIRLPFHLNRVKQFYLPFIVLTESHSLSSTLCLLRSFPYLVYLEIKVWNEYDAGVQEPLELERFSDVTFNHLREVKLECCTTTTPVMQLIKLLLAKSPVLVKMLIVLDCIYDGDERLNIRSKILAEISKLLHASPKVDIELVV